VDKKNGEHGGKRKFEGQNYLWSSLNLKTATTGALEGTEIEKGGGVLIKNRLYIRLGKFFKEKGKPQQAWGDYGGMGQKR